MTQTRKKRLLWALCLAALALFAAAMVWLHYQQLCATGRGEDPYTSDLGQHLHFAQSGLIYSATSLLIGPAYAAGGKLGIALLLAVFHLAAVVVFAWGLKAALPEWSLPARLLASFVVNLAQAVYIPRGGYWYQGTVTGTIYHNTTYIMLAPFALLAVLWFYRAWQGIDGRIDLRTWLIYTAFLTAATAFKANLIFAFAPALLVLLIADFIHTRTKNIGNEVLMGCSVFPGVGLCILEANVLFNEEGSGLRLIFTTEFDRHALLWGVFNEAALLGLLRSLPFVAAVALLLRRPAFGSFRRHGRSPAAGGGRRPAVPRQPLVGAVHLLLGALAGIGGHLPQAGTRQAQKRQHRPVRRGAGLAHHQRRVLSGAADAGSLLQRADYDLPYRLLKSNILQAVCARQAACFSFATCRTQPNAV